MLPRKLPGPNNTVVDAKPAYDAAIKTARPALQKLYADTFAKNRLDAIVFPTVPKVAVLSNPDSSSLANFGGYIQNTDPGSNAGLPGMQIPVALGAASKLPVGLELDGPAAATAGCWPSGCPGEAVRPAAEAREDVIVAWGAVVSRRAPRSVSTQQARHGRA